MRNFLSIVILIREIIGNLSWIVFFIFSILSVKRKKYLLLSFCLALFFGSLFINDAEKMEVGTEGFSFSRKLIESRRQEKAPSEISSVFLTQEYPSVPGTKYTESIDLQDNPALMKWQEKEQSFWVGVNNIGSQNLTNPILFLDFDGRAEITVDKNASRGWVEAIPGFKYYNKINTSIQPETGVRLNSLLVKFPKEENYPVSFTISSDNQKPISGIFKISVKKY